MKLAHLDAHLTHHYATVPLIGSVRLACVRHLVSVRSEPRSHTHLIAIPAKESPGAQPAYQHEPALASRSIYFSLAKPGKT